MSKLLKVDFFKILKSKMTIIGLILCIVLPLLSSLLYLGLELLLNFEVEISEMGFSARNLMAAGYSISNDLGIIVPVFSAVFVAGDISNGILRNKVISGAKKTNIYLSHFITTAIFNIVLINIYALVSILFNSLILGYGRTFDSSEFLLLLKCMGMGTLGFIFMASITTLLALLTKSMPLSIILTITFCMVSGIISTVLIMADISKYGRILSIIPMYSFSLFTSLLDGVDSVILIIGSVSLVIYTAINVILGMMIFKKCDIK